MIKKILILVGALFVANAHDTMALTTEPVKSKPGANPYLAGEMYAITHFNPAQSDAFPYPAAQGTFYVNLRDYPRVTGRSYRLYAAHLNRPELYVGIDYRRNQFCGYNRWRLESSG